MASPPCVPTSWFDPVTSTTDVIYEFTDFARTLAASIAAAARRRGMSTKQFMVDAALKEAEGTDWAKFFAAHPPAVLPKLAPRDLSTHEAFRG